MNQRDLHAQALGEHFGQFLCNGDAAPLREYLVQRSRLPGPRGNLELAGAFAQRAESSAEDNPDCIWDLCLTFAQLSADEAPTNDPQEFIAFCGVRGLAAVGAVCASYFEEALSRLFDLSHDPRWRVREAVAMAIQRLVEADFNRVLSALEGWIQDEDWLAMRAVATGVAEPRVLREAAIAKQAFKLHQAIVACIVASADRRSEEFKAMRKGLGYTFSVIAAALPQKGFQVLRKLATSGDKDLLWIAEKNLKKSRLVKHFPDEVDRCQEVIKQDA